MEGPGFSRCDAVTVTRRLFNGYGCHRVMMMSMQRLQNSKVMNHHIISLNIPYVLRKYIYKNQNQPAITRLQSLSHTRQELGQAKGAGVRDLADPAVLAADVNRAAQRRLHVLAGLAAVLRGLGGHVHVLGLLECGAEGDQGVDHGSVAGLGRGVFGQGVEGVLERLGPDVGGDRGGGARVLLAEAVGQGVQEDGVDGAGGAVHAVFDDGDDAEHGLDDVVVEVGGRVFKEGQDGFCAALQADAAVAVPDDGVVLGDQRLGGDDALEALSEDLLKDGGVH